MRSVQVLECDASHGGSSFSLKEKDEGGDNDKVELRREIRAWWDDTGKRLESLEGKEAEVGIVRILRLQYRPPFFEKPFF